VVETVGPGTASQSDEPPAVELPDETPVLGLLELSIQNFLAKEFRVHHNKGLTVREPFEGLVVHRATRHHCVPELCREGLGSLFLAALGLAYYRWSREFDVDVGGWIRTATRTATRISTRAVVGNESFPLLVGTSC